MIVASDEELVTRMRRIRNYGQSVRYEHPEVGMNSRLDEIHAAMLSERLVWLEPFTARRREIAAAYRRGINNPQVRLLAPPEDPQAHVFHLFVVICSKRDALQAYLQARNVQALIHYPIPMHRQVPCTGLARDPEGLSNTEQHAATCLSLPCHPQMTDAQVHEVITAINAFSLG
jgi:dTDP-4-amino-4,6-dideoxygalactose transaminase